MFVYEDNDIPSKEQDNKGSYFPLSDQKAINENNIRGQ